jgi:hypothetical protein
MRLVQMRHALGAWLDARLGGSSPGKKNPPEAFEHSGGSVLLAHVYLSPAHEPE